MKILRRSEDSLWNFEQYGEWTTSERLRHRGCNKDYDNAVWKSLRTLVKLQTNKKCRSDYKAEHVFDLIVAGFQMNISWKGEGKDRCNMWSCMNVILKLCFGVAGADRFQLLWGFTQPVNSTIWLYIRYVSDFWVSR